MLRRHLLGEQAQAVKRASLHACVTWRACGSPNASGSLRAAWLATPRALAVSCSFYLLLLLFSFFSLSLTDAALSRSPPTGSGDRCEYMRPSFEGESSRPCWSPSAAPPARPAPPYRRVFKNTFLLRLCERARGGGLRGQESQRACTLLARTGEAIERARAGDRAKGPSERTQGPSERASEQASPFGGRVATTVSPWRQQGLRGAAVRHVLNLENPCTPGVAGCAWGVLYCRV